jgi:shikimate 5-dehydrogenase
MSSPRLPLALFGEHIAHSRSPALHAALAASRGLSIEYHLLPSPPEGFEGALRAARALGVVGASVTSPHKSAAAERAHRLTPTARALGAVNALRWRGETLEGHNTDLEGVTLTLRALLGGGVTPLVGRGACVVGARGAAAAAAVACLDLGAAHLVVLSRREAEGRAFTRWLCASHPRGSSVRIEWRSAEGVTQAPLEPLEIGAIALACPPLPAHALAGLLPAAQLRFGDPSAPHAAMSGAVLDMSYGARAEGSLRWAQSVGLKPLDPRALLTSSVEGGWVDGALMLAAQGVSAFRWWLDLPPEAPLSLEVALEAVLGAGPLP